MTRRVILYARLSVVSRGQKSVSIERQLGSGRDFCKAMGWSVVAEFVDDGVSATHIRPEAREGWRRVLEYPEGFDLALVWSIDRLARKVIDFLHADERLRARGANLATVRDHIDMSSPNGRLFATLLASFAEAEAEAIRARVKAAREVLIKAGRVVGGTVPYGWMSVPNPTGNGLVLAQDPHRIKWVRGMAERALNGHSVYSICRWLDEDGAPLPSTSQATRNSARWNYSTVERLLRNPVLAGMTQYNPGRGRRSPADPTAVLRDDNGMPLINDSVAILTTDERRRLLELLDTRDTPQARPRASKGITSPLLSALANCGACDRTMHRGTTQGRPSLSCPACHQVISRSQLDRHVTARLLNERGHERLWEHVESTEDNSAELADLEEAIRDTTDLLGDDNADVPGLIERLNALKQRRRTARLGSPAHSTWRITGQTVRQAWAAAKGDLERRDILLGQMASLRIIRGKVGRYLDRNRVSIEWRPIPEGIPLPDGTRLVRRVGAVPEGEGRVGPPVITLPDETMLYST